MESAARNGQLFGVPLMEHEPEVFDDLHETLKKRGACGKCEACARGERCRSRRASTDWDKARSGRGLAVRAAGREVKLHVVGADDPLAVLVAYPLPREGAGGLREFVRGAESLATIAFTAAHGHVDGAILQAAGKALEEREGVLEGIARCVTTTWLIHVMPTSLIGRTIDLLSEAVRGMADAARERELRAAEAEQCPVDPRSLARWAERELPTPAPIPWNEANRRLVRAAEETRRHPPERAPERPAQPVAERPATRRPDKDGSRRRADGAPRQPAEGAPGRPTQPVATRPGAAGRPEIPVQASAAQSPGQAAPGPDDPFRSRSASEPPSRSPGRPSRRHRLRRAELPGVEKGKQVSDPSAVGRERPSVAPQSGRSATSSLPESPGGQRSTPRSKPPLRGIPKGR